MPTSETPKVTGTGTMKNATTGSSVKANESIAKEGVVTGDKFDNNITEVEGEILQGDSFRILFKKGNVNFAIPIPLQNREDIIVLDNTFKIISEIQKTETKEELEDKFASFIQ